MCEVRKNGLIRTLTVVLAIVILVVFAGCRGRSSKHYGLVASRACFAQNGDRVHRETDSDYKASGGWLAVEYSDYTVSIGFTGDESEANRLREQLLRDDLFSAVLGPADVIRRGNAVYLSNSQTIEIDTRDKIEACLK